MATNNAAYYELGDTLRWEIPAGCSHVGWSGMNGYKRHEGVIVEVVQPNEAPKLYRGSPRPFVNYVVREGDELYRPSLSKIVASIKKSAASPSTPEGEKK